MHSRNVFAGFLIAMVSFALSARVAAQGTWAVEKTFHVGGDGGMDYVTLDAKNHRLYVPRSTHTMVIDADSGKTIRGHSRPEAQPWGCPGSRGRTRIHQRRERRGRDFRSQDECCPGNAQSATRC